MFQVFGYWDKCSVDCEGPCPANSKCVAQENWKNDAGVALACVCDSGYDCVPNPQCLASQPPLITSVADGGYCHAKSSTACCQYQSGMPRTAPHNNMAHTLSIGRTPYCNTDHLVTNMCCAGDMKTESPCDCASIQTCGGLCCASSHA
jgi:hypothetical protein